jgi:FkbM family methyltransferase
MLIQNRFLSYEYGDIPLIQKLWKPWFVHRPMQIFQRVHTDLLPPASGYQPLSTSWGITVYADPTKTIGRSILTTGVYDLTVSETLARLITPGDTVIDAGANIGYMTLLSAMAAGSTGTVLAFEPHPDLFPIIQQNLMATKARYRVAHAELHNEALGAEPGIARLQLPSGFTANDGIAQIVSTVDAETPSIAVTVNTLDAILGQKSATVLKLDVEGFELQVLQGSIRAIAEKRIRHIVFEDHNSEQSDVVRFLQDHGYHVYAIGWSMNGLSIAPIASGRLSTLYEAPNFIATIAPDEVTARCQSKGWLVLGNSLIDRYPDLSHSHIN